MTLRSGLASRPVNVWLKYSLQTFRRGSGHVPQFDDLSLGREKVDPNSLLKEVCVVDALTLKRDNEHDESNESTGPTDMPRESGNVSFSKLSAPRSRAPPSHASVIRRNYLLSTFKRSLKLGDALALFSAVTSLSAENALLSPAELRAALDVFLTAQPLPTRKALERAIYVVDLIAQQTGAELELAVNDAQYQIPHARALTHRQWIALVRLVGLSFRAPRPKHEVENALTLFIHWKKHARAPPATRVDMYAALLAVCSRAKMWSLFESLRLQMTRDGLRDTLLIRLLLLQKLDLQGASYDDLTTHFLETLRLYHHDKNSKSGLFNLYMHTILKRGYVHEAVELYQRMEARAHLSYESLCDMLSVNPGTSDMLSADAGGVAGASGGASGVGGTGDALSATPSAAPPLKWIAPRSDYETLATLINGLCYHGEFDGAFTILSSLVRRFKPEVSVFNSFFRAFAKYGQRVNSTSIVDQLFDISAPYKKHSQALPLHNVLSKHKDDTRWTLEQLDIVFEMLMNLTPDPKAHRTAPSYKTLYWIILSYENLTGGDSETVLSIWERLEGKFADRSVWSGWGPDNRIRRKITKHYTRFHNDTETSTL